MDNSPTYSIAICTYNNSSILQLALESIFNLYGSVSNIPIIVIDNNSTDDTISIIEPFKIKLPTLKYFLEIKQGISHARNKAAEVCETDYIAYIDDDAQLHPDYAIKLKSCINSTKADIIGGPYYPYYIHEKPNWFKDQYEIRLHKNESGWMNSNAISESNMIIRMDLFKHIGNFNSSYGHIGKTLSYGEGADFVLRARIQHYTVYYSCEVIIYHLVPQYKMNLLFFMANHYFAGQASFKIKNQNNHWTPGLILRHIDNIFEKINILIRSSEHIENDYIEERAYDFNILGQYVAYLKQELNINNIDDSSLDKIQGLSLINDKITFRNYFKLWFKLTKKLLKGLL